MTIPESIINWATGTFSGSYDLTDVVIKAPIKELPTMTFENCSSLTNLELPNTIEVLGQYAIGDGRSIKKFQIPTSLKELQWNSVILFPVLEEIILPEENKNFNLIDGVLYSKDMKWLYLYPSGDKTRERFVIPEGVTNTFHSSISGENLREVVIPNSMTELTPGFIYNTPNLETLVLPDDMTTVPEFSFPLPQYLTLSKNLWKMYPQSADCDRTHHVYCNNIHTLTDFNISNTIYDEDKIVVNYYSGYLTPNIILSYNSNIESHLYIPDYANWKESNFKKENIHYMWDYYFNRTQHAFSLTNILSDVEILSVKVNGEYVNKTNGLYHYSGNEVPDVTIEYRLHGRQIMTTNYTSKFNSDTDFTKVQKITLDNSDSELYIGQSLKLSAVVTPEFAINKAVEWSSNNHEVATVDQYGNVSAIAQGTATITVKATDGSGVSATCHVTVNPVLVESLTLSPDSWSGTEGETFQITATVMPDNATNKTIEWTTSNAAVATVDDNGNISTHAVGEATITASATDGSGVSASCHVTVSPVLVESLTLSPESWSGTEGETFQITATLMPDNATNKTIEWTTSDAAVATVDEAGVVSVLKAGSCVITASTVDGSGVSAECIITGASGIDSMFADGVKVDVYNANGVLLKRGCGKTELKSLAPGVYIVRDKNKAKTIMVY